MRTRGAFIRLELASVGWALGAERGGPIRARNDVGILGVSGGSNPPLGSGHSREHSANPPSSASGGCQTGTILVPDIGVQTAEQPRPDIPLRDSDGRSARIHRSERRKTWRSPIYLHARVVTDRGEPPPETVEVRLDCGSKTIPWGFTDRKGHFSLQSFNNRSIRTIMSDASLTPSSLRSIA